MLWRFGRVLVILSSVKSILQRSGPERLRIRSPFPQSWPAGLNSALKTSRSGRQTAAGLQRWLMISERACWNSWGAAMISLSFSQLSSSPPAATLRKLRWGHDCHLRQHYIQRFVFFYKYPITFHKDLNTTACTYTSTIYCNSAQQLCHNFCLYGVHNVRFVSSEMCNYMFTSEAIDRGGAVLHNNTPVNMMQSSPTPWLTMTSVLRHVIYLTVLWQRQQKMTTEGIIYVDFNADGLDSAEPPKRLFHYLAIITKPMIFHNYAVTKHWVWNWPPNVVQTWNQVW